ncbi:MAG: SDR family oxidoreductase [Acidimicrobiales bacterium]|nr:SDR family oxidoreductase [Acidimicrobiales bacterium]RZV42950.1 MAG: SDR family oxidoreductase [Acidimicrobiales bacterium]
MASENPVAIVSNASSYVGPALATKLARAGFDLVLGDPTPEVLAEVEESGVQSWVVDSVHNLAKPDAAPRLLDMAMDAYGRVDSAVFFTGEIVLGKVVDSTDADFEKVVAGNLEAAYRALRTFVRPMIDANQGQILAITSASGLRPTPGAPLYSATRAAANMLVKNLAGEVARNGVQVNAVGTNFMDFPMFREAMGADDPEVMAKIEKNVPMGRLGTMDEFANFCMAFLDGSARFQTGQVVGFDGGWSN